MYRIQICSGSFGLSREYGNVIPISHIHVFPTNHQQVRLAFFMVRPRIALQLHFSTSPSRRDGVFRGREVLRCLGFRI